MLNNINGILGLPWGNMQVSPEQLNLNTSDSVVLSDAAKTGATTGAEAAAGAEGAAKEGDAKVTDAKAGANTEATEAAKAASAVSYEDFAKTFTPEKVAELFGLDASKLTDKQVEGLTKFLYGIQQENAKRAEKGEEPLTKEEINEAITQYIEEYKAAAKEGKGDDESVLIGKALSELGIEELTDEQYDAITKAVSEFNTKTVEEAKKAEEAEKAKEAEQAEEANQNNEASEAGDAGGTEAAGGTNSAGGTNGANGGGDAAAKSFDLAEDLPGLQAQKAEAQAKLGELNGQIDSKNAEINARKGQLAEEHAKAGDAKGQGLREEYNKAKTDYDTANTAKQKAQGDLTTTNNDIATNNTNLYKNAQSLADVENQISALGSRPEVKEDDEASAQAAAAWDAQKSALDSQKSSLESEKSQLETERTNLDTKKTELETEIQTQTDKMADAQKIMNEKMEALMKDDPELKKAIEEDEQIKTLQSEIENLKSEVKTQEELIAACDQEIAVKEQQDAAIRDMREEEAKADLTATLTQNGVEPAEIQNAAQDSVAQEKYGKNFAELSDEEKAAIEYEVDGRYATESIEWAKEALREDPSNAQAQAVIDAAGTYLDNRAANAFMDSFTAYDALPAELKVAAGDAAQAAIEAAQANGTDVDVAAREAISKYLADQLENGELSDKDRAAVENASRAADRDLAATQEMNRAEEVKKEAAYFQQIAELPEPVGSEMQILNESINALDDRSGVDYFVQKAYNQVEKYLQDNPDLTMAEAKEKFGDYGPVALAAIKDESGKTYELLFGAEGEEAPYVERDDWYEKVGWQGKDSDAGRYTGNQTDLAMAAITGYSAAKVEDAKAMHNASDSTSDSADEWLSTGTDSYARETRMYQALSMGVQPTPAATEPNAATAALVEELSFDPMNGTEWGKNLAADAEKNVAGTYGWCLRGVAQALARHGVNIGGASAYMAADQLAANENFTEVSGLSDADLKTLPAGAVVVWDHGNGHEHGHICISLGDGREVSDHIANMTQNYGTSFRVFLPNENTENLN